MKNVTPCFLVFTLFIFMLHSHPLTQSVPLSGAGAEIGVSSNYNGTDCVDRFYEGTVIFSDRTYTLQSCPEFLKGNFFLRSDMDTPPPLFFNVTKDGVLTVLTPESSQFQSAQYEALENRAFIHITEPALFQLFGDMLANKVRTYQKNVKAGEQYEFNKWTVVLGFTNLVGSTWTPRIEPGAWNTNNGELLYNGIRLPQVWPPEHINWATVKPMPVPYLDYPPAILPINIGRQLFVDDFLIETTDLKRTFHYPEKYTGNPLLSPATALETNNVLPIACPKSGGLWWDSDEQVFKLWYEAGWLNTICYATSTNGFTWDRPKLNIIGTNDSNQIWPLTKTASSTLKPDSWTVVRDWWTSDPNAKYKIFVRPPGGLATNAMCFESPDGIHLSTNSMTISGVMGDRSTMFYNPFRQKWVFSLRSSFQGRGRSRHYWEASNFMTGNTWAAQNLDGINWQKGQPVIWTGADELDLPDPVEKVTPQLYNLDAVAYESVMLGFYQIYRGDRGSSNGIPKITELNFAYSRDGFYWHRPDRTTAIKAERTAGTWDRGYVQSLGNICTVRGDKLWFYYTGFAGDEAWLNGTHGKYVNGAMGVAFLRRDGFASMDAGDQPATLTTRPVIFTGRCLFVNAAITNGTLRAEVLDESGTPIAPFTLTNSIPFSSDSTIKSMGWTSGNDLSALQNRPVRFRFVLSGGALYSFWVSKDETGRSDGYVAGGGPGFTGPTDTVGTNAIQANARMLGL